MKYFFVFYIFFLFTPISASDFSVIINGNFPGAENRHIRLMKYSDQITYTTKELDDAVIDKNGSFLLEFETYEPIYIFYRIDHARMGHYVEPGREYKIDFDTLNFDTLDDRRNPYLDPWSFNFELYKDNKPDKLNEAISKLNSSFNDFLSEHISDIGRRRLNKPFREFKEYADSLFKIDTIEHNSYFKNHYEYKFALYYRIANLKNPLRLFDEYIIDRPVLYENTRYMDFFNTVFDRYIFTGSRNIRTEDLTVSVNRHNSYYALMDSLGKDTVLRNEVLRELVMLKGLKDMYHNPDYNKHNVASIVEYVKNNSKFPQHRKIASNTLKRFNYMAEGYPAPNLDLETKNGKIVCIEDYNGKLLLLNFWTSWCMPCHAEFSVLNDLYEKYGDTVTFLSISVDRHYSDYKRFINSNRYNWDFYHFNQNFRLLDRYKVRQFPFFVLIDPEGKIIDNSAPFPSRGLERKIEKVIDQYN